MSLNKLYIGNEFGWPTPLCPDLTESSRSSRLLGQYFKDCTTLGQKKWDAMGVSSLPLKVTAASIRRGCINEFLQFMPEHFVALATGHDRRDRSALFEYFTPERTGLNPVSIYQGGDEAPFWGRLGICRAPESVQYLPKEVVEKIEEMVDAMAQIDEGSHLNVQRGGSLRPSLLAGFASQIMHYEERNKTGMFVNPVVHSLLFCMYLIKQLNVYRRNARSMP